MSFLSWPRPRPHHRKLPPILSTGPRTPLIALLRTSPTLTRGRSLSRISASARRYGFSIMGGDLRVHKASDGSGPAEQSSAAVPPSVHPSPCSPVYVSRIKPGSPADGSLKVGTQITAINGVCIIGRDHKNVSCTRAFKSRTTALYFLGAPHCRVK